MQDRFFLRRHPELQRFVEDMKLLYITHVLLRFQREVYPNEIPASEAHEHIFKKNCRKCREEFRQLLLKIGHTVKAGEPLISAQEILTQLNEKDDKDYVPETAKILQFPVKKKE